MKCLILAAGYATRLYPLTENFPKPLLKVGEKAVIDWLVDDIDTSGAIDEYIVISNHKFVSFFDEWAKNKKPRITVIDDGSTTNENRLGAVCDMLLAIEKMNICDDILVIAADNVLDFSLVKFIEYTYEKKASCVMRYFEPDFKKLQKCGVVSVDDTDLVLSMTEKSLNPATHWCCPPFYFYTASDSKLIKSGVESGCGTDAPGSYVAWLANRSSVYSMEMPGKRYDIGNIESYEKIKSEYRGIIK